MSRRSASASGRPHRHHQARETALPATPGAARASTSDVLLGQDEGALDDVLQLAHVARPVVLAQPLTAGGGELLAPCPPPR